MTKDDWIEYFVFVEGPTFTNSQMGGHPFYDCDMENLYFQGMYEEGDNYILKTELKPEEDIVGNEGITLEDFYDWFKRKQKGNTYIVRAFEDIDYSQEDMGLIQTLIKEGNQFFIISSISKEDLEEIQKHNK